MNRQSLEFGHGSFVGGIMADPQFFNLPARDQARVMGWVASCPVVEELTDPANPNPGRGPEIMIERYGQVNFWFGYIADEVEKLNPTLHDQLMVNIPRLKDEPVGKYEPESIPPTYLTEIAPMSTLAGYALPRLFTEQIGIGKNLTDKEVRQRYATAHASLQHAAKRAATPNELLAIMAEDIAQSDVEPQKVLSLILPAGWLAEHNAITMLEDFKQSLAELAPNLWHEYAKLSASEIEERKLI